jgi:hypothetical protein
VETRQRKVWLARSVLLMFSTDWHTDRREKFTSAASIQRSRQRKAQSWLSLSK